MTENNVLVLSKPITVLGETISEIRFREPTGKDLRSLPIIREGMTMGSLMDFAGKLAVVTVAGKEMRGLPPESFDQMTPKDALEAIGIIGPFFL